MPISRSPELVERPLHDHDLVAMFIDGKELGDTTLIISLGLDSDGRKHVLGIWDGATENSVVVGALLDDMIDRGVAPDRPYLFVLDGSKALRKAVECRFGRINIQRCQEHKKRNVVSHLPKEYRESVLRRMRIAYGMVDFKKAKGELEKTVEWLRTINVSAARSLEEGLEETLTVYKLQLPETLRVSLRTTNIIESALSGAEWTSRNVKSWRGRDQARRLWIKWVREGILL